MIGIAMDAEQRIPLCGSIGLLAPSLLPYGLLGLHKSFEEQVMSFSPIAAE